MYLGIDYGKKRIGLALGEMIPRGAGVLDGTKSRGQLVEEIKKICIDNEVDIIVMGLPMRRGGEEGNLVPEIKKFADLISIGTGIKVLFESEELTSFGAEEMIRDSGKRYSRGSGKTDELAAIIILEQFIKGQSDKR